MPTDTADKEMTMSLKCYRIDDGGVTSYVAAAHHADALRLLWSLEMGDEWTPEITTTLILDEKVPDFTVEQSAEGDSEDFTLVELLAKARAKGEAILLCSSEF